MALILSNDTSIETSWYVYQERNEIYRDEIDAEEGYFVGKVSGEVGVTIGSYWEGAVQAEEFTGVIIGPDLQSLPDNTLGLRNDLRVETWWYVYGPDGTELFNATLRYGQEVVVPNPPEGLCRIKVLSVGGDPAIATVDTTPGVRVALNVRVMAQPPMWTPTR